MHHYAALLLIIIILDLTLMKQLIVQIAMRAGITI
jgi:hypothetical protein